MADCSVFEPLELLEQSLDKERKRARSSEGKSLSSSFVIREERKPIRRVHTHNDLSLKTSPVVSFLASDIESNSLEIPHLN